MKKIIGIILITLFMLPPFVIAETYEFTEIELDSFVTNIVEEVTDDKDLEIASLIEEHDLLIVDKDLTIKELKVSEFSLKEEISLLENVNARQSTLLRWAPVVVVTTFVTGVITGIITAGNL